MTVIKLQSNFIEFPFEDNNGKTVLTLKFDKSDENKKRLEDVMEKYNEKIKELEDGGAKTVDDSTALLRTAVDDIFGEGSFESMYKISPATEIVLEYFYQMVGGIKKEYDEKVMEDKLNKYLS